MQASVFIAASLDGFIARPDGNLDWLHAAAPESNEDYGYAAFTDSIDCLIMGRATFEHVLAFEEWPYGDMRMIVLSKTLGQLPEKAPETVELYSGDLAQLLQRLEGEGHRRAYVDGGQTIQSFLREGLLTDMTITTVPMLIGTGLPLFGPLPGDVRLKHVRTTTYPSGFVQSVYAV